MKSVRYAALCVAAACACSSSAFADGHFDSAIKARQGMMQVLAFNLGPLGAMVKGEADYDAEAAATFAKNLETLALMDTGAMWPAGSDSGALGEDKTRALPAGWDPEGKVGEKVEAWVTASTNLAAVAGDGLDSLKGAFGDVAKSCGGCHDDYRAAKK